MGVQAGDRVATLAWNDHRHFELYYAIAGVGAVCDTLNLVWRRTRSAPWPRMPATLKWHAEAAFEK